MGQHLAAMLVVLAGAMPAAGCASDGVRMDPLPPVYARYAGRAFELLEVQEFRLAFEKILPEGAPKWFRALEGPSPPAGWVGVGEQGYIVVHSCKPHACRWNRVIMLFGPVPPYRVVAALVQDPDEEGPAMPEVRWLGRPEPDERSVLESLMGQRL